MDQCRRQAIAYTREAEGGWGRLEFSGAEAVSLPALDAPLPLDAIYEGIELPPLVVGEGEEEWNGEGDDEG